MEDISKPLDRLRGLTVEYADTGLDHNQIYEKLEANHPNVVDGFVLTQRRQLVVQAIRMIVGQKRRQRFHQVRFGDATTRIEAGEQLLVVSFPSADGSRKSLVDMNRDDLVYAATVRESHGRTLISEARLLRQLARKVTRGRTVGDVYTAEQIADLVHRFTEVAA